MSLRLHLLGALASRRPVGSRKPEHAAETAALGFGLASHLNRRMLRAQRLQASQRAGTGEDVAAGGGDGLRVTGRPKPGESGGAGGWTGAIGGSMATVADEANAGEATPIAGVSGG